MKTIISVGNMNPEDDSEAASDKILITRSPAIVSSSEVSASITSPNPGLKKKIRNSGRFEQRISISLKVISKTFCGRIFISTV